MPNFKTGSHDRVFSGQLNGAVSLTDPTSLLRSEYNNKESILFYDLDNIDAVTTMLDSALNNQNELKKIAQAGYAIASQNHTWDNIAKKLLSAI